MGSDGIYPAGYRSLSAAQTAQLEHYVKLMREHNKRLNLVSAGDTRHLEERHIADSLTALQVTSCDGKMIVDIGSGAGLPGVVLAIALPSARITCVERTRKRAAFIKLASHELQLANLSVEWADAVDLCLDEKYACSADIVTIRAVAGTGDALSLAAGFLKKTGSALLWQSADQMAREAVPASFSATWFQTVSATGSERGIRVCRLASAI